MLSYPQKGELYGNFVSQEYNGYYCQSTQAYLTRHLDWLYQSIAALEEGDVWLVSGDFIFFGSILDSVEAALSRGAMVIMTTIRFNVGGRDAEGNCYSCGSQGTPFACDDVSTEGTLYGSWACAPSNQQLQVLLGYPNFFNLELPTYLPIGPHLKTQSFYLASSGRASIYTGSLNLDERILESNIGEIGIGWVAPLTDDFAQFHLMRDTNFLTMLEGYFSNVPVTSTYLQKLVIGAWPKQPILVPTVYFNGPNYCDANWGCQAVGPRTDSKTCGTSTETWNVSVDSNVSFTFGVDPAPGTAPIQNWGTTGWNSGIPYGLDLLTSLYDGSTVFVKTIIHSQMLENGNSGGQWDMVPALETSIHAALQRGVNWFCMENANGWETSTGNTLIQRIKQSSTEWPHMFAKVVSLCGVSPVDPLTHAKIYMSDKALLLSSSHGNNVQYASTTLNEDLLITGAPGILQYFNNYYTYYWNFCGTYPAIFTPSVPVVLLCSSTPVKQGTQFLSYDCDTTCNISTDPNCKTCAGSQGTCGPCSAAKLTVSQRQESLTVEAGICISIWLLLGLVVVLHMK